MKTLKTIISENRKYITAGKVDYCYIGGRSDGSDVALSVDLDNLTSEQLKKRYAEWQWWVEDGALCIK
jgi:hypothetical protein